MLIFFLHGKMFLAHFTNQRNLGMFFFHHVMVQFKHSKYFAESWQARCAVVGWIILAKLRHINECNKKQANDECIHQRKTLPWFDSVWSLFLPKNPEITCPPIVFPFMQVPFKCAIAVTLFSWGFAVTLALENKNKKMNHAVNLVGEWLFFFFVLETPETRHFFWEHLGAWGLTFFGVTFYSMVWPHWVRKTI